MAGLVWWAAFCWSWLRTLDADVRAGGWQPASECNAALVVLIWGGAGSVLALFPL